MMMQTEKEDSKESGNAGNELLASFPAFLLSLAMFFFCALSGAASAQSVQGSPNEEDPLGPPTQRGIRMTPGMARMVAQLFTEQVLVKQHQLDKTKAEEAAELVA